MSEAEGAASSSHRAQVEVLLGSILRLMDYPAKLDFRDMTDGALGVAVHFQGELPGVTPGKRSPLVDCLQFLLNKAINRPSVPRRWVNLGVNAFPEPRAAQPVSAERPKAAAQAVRPPPPAAMEKPAQRKEAPAKPSRAPAPSAEEPRAVAADPLWTSLGRALAEKAHSKGRVYAVMMLSPERRAQLLGAVDGAAGVTAKVEGDGHWKRLAVTPDTLAPLPKKHVMPDWDDEDGA